MDGTNKSPERRKVAEERLSIREHWNSKQRRQRRRTAEAKQHELWRLVKSSTANPMVGGFENPRGQDRTTPGRGSRC